MVYQSWHIKFCKLEIGSAYKKHEGEKKRGYNARVLNVEKATFTPLVFSTHGGMGKEAEAFHKRLASLIATKRGQLYSDVMSFVRRRLRFCILRSCLAAIRGYRGKPCFVDSSADINLIPEERGYFWMYLFSYYYILTWHSKYWPWNDIFNL